MSATTDQLLNNIRLRVPGAVDPAIEAELFNVVDDLTRFYIQTDPPTPGTAMSAWLTDNLYRSYFQVLLDGVCARLMSQQAKPYANPALAALHQERYQAGALRARDITAVTPSPGDRTERLMDNLRISLPGAIDQTIKTELWNTINRACRDGFIWREVIPVPLTISDDTYTIAPEGTEIVSVLAVQHSTMPTSKAVYQFGVLTLFALPTVQDVPYPLYVQAAMAPTLTTGADVENLIPEDMWSENFELFLHGTLSRMMIQPAKPYSNPQLAQYHGREFSSRLAQAKRKVATGGAFSPQAWTYPRWA